MGYDRNEVLDRTDLADLADQLVGPHKGRGTSATWPCPDAGHGTQTGRTPPVSIFRTRYGDERWRCHSCGAGGTAIDLVMTTQGVRFPEALELLGRRAGVGSVDRPAPHLRTARIQRPPSVPPERPSPDVERFVAGAEAWLWSEQGLPMRRWLSDRGLGDEVLRANRVGADPGPASLERVRGLPRGGPAVVLPVLAADGTAMYLQSRYLQPRSHKYDNPSAALAGPLPRAAEVRLPHPPKDPGLVVVSEGIPDALVAAQAGYRAAAVLGAGVPDERTAAALVERFPIERLVIAFDADDPGHAGAERLRELFGETGAVNRVATLEVPAVASDLNGWQQAAGAGFGDQLARAIDRANEGDRPMSFTPDRGSAEAPVTAGRDGRSTSVEGRGADDQHTGLPPDQAQAFHPSRGRRVDLDPELDDLVETIYYHHVLVDDPELAVANVARIEQAVGTWNDQSLAHPTAGMAPAPEMAELDQRLEDIAYRHVLVDDPNLAARNLGALRTTVADWSTELADTGLRPGELEDDVDWGPDVTAAERWACDHGLSPVNTAMEPPILDVVAIDF